MVIWIWKLPIKIFNYAPIALTLVAALHRVQRATRQQPHLAPLLVRKGRLLGHLIHEFPLYFVNYWLLFF